MKIVKILPLIIVIIFCIIGAIKIYNKNRPDIAISASKSNLISQQVPEFSAETLFGDKDSILSDRQLRGKYSLVNFFASWCVACKVEHPFLMKIKNEINIYGINWKDKRDNAEAFLAHSGNPYKKIARDIDGQIAVAFAITGAPESFVISPSGRVIYHYPGVLTQQIFDEEILPLIIK